MTSRERIRAALNHEPVDMLPIDFGAMRSTGINAMAYNKLLKKLGFEDRCAKVYDVFQQLAEPDMDVLARMGGDVVQAHRLAPAFGFPIDAWKEGTLQDGSPCLFPATYNPVEGEKGYDILDGTGRPIARMPKGGLYFDTIYHPCQEFESIEDVEGYEFARMSEEEIDFIEKECKTLYETTDKAILFAFGGNVFEAGQGDFGYEDFYCNLAAEPEMMHAWFEKLTDSYIDNMSRLLPRIAEYIDIVQFGDDLGTQLTLQVSPDMYREMIKPYHKKVWGYVRENFPKLKVFLHSCGAIYDAIPDLIDAGVQILNPIQISADGMDPKKLKAEFGKDLVFWGGGADMQIFVPEHDEEAIKAHVRELIEIFSQDSGFVFTQVHNIQSNIPPEKILAIYDTAQEYRR